MSYCVNDGCYNQRLSGSPRCARHCVDMTRFEGCELTPVERAEIVISELEAIKQKRARLQAFGAAGLGVAGAAVVVGMGAGALGVVFVAGLTVGVFSLFKASE